jgi:hypothetical protein
MPTRFGVPNTLRALSELIVMNHQACQVGAWDYTHGRFRLPGKYETACLFMRFREVSLVMLISEHPGRF